jgi:hypothetical protein
MRAAADSSALPRVAAGVVLLLVLVTWAGVWLATTGSGAGSSMRAPFALAVTAIALPIAAGLWLRRPWSYWVGLIAGSWQLISHVLFLIVGLAAGRALGLGDWLFGLLLAVFVTVLLIPATRRGCMPRPAESTH